MKRVKSLDELQVLDSAELRDFLAAKAQRLMSDYNVPDLSDIGEFAVLEKDEVEQFDTSAMEFVEVIQLASETYLHGVKIIDDGYGDDIYLPVEVVKC